MHSKKLKILFYLSIFAGFLSIAFLVLSLFFRYFLGFTREELILDSIAFLMLSFWFLSWALVYHHFKHEEFRNIFNLILDFLKRLLNIRKTEKEIKIE
jgi:hypothetical protein